MAQVQNPQDADTRLARLWLIHWLEIEPTTKRYQEAVSLSRVLADHRAALGAEPFIEGEPAGKGVDAERKAEGKPSKLLTTGESQHV